jgi:adenylate kinase family enzyme
MINKFQTVSVLLESILFSDKNYGLDLNLFPKKIKTLFIVGLSGTEKTTLSERLKKSVPNCEVINLDDVWTKQMEKNVEKENDKENIVKTNLRTMGEYLKKLVKDRSNVRIIEGVHLFYLYELFGSSYIQFIEQYPTILLGTSILKSSIQQLKRDKTKFKLKYVLYTAYDESEYKKFRNILLSNKNRKKEIVNI